MNNISRSLKRWMQNSNMTLDDMAHKVFERGWNEYRVLTYDELKEHVLLMVEQGNYAAKLLQSLEENRRADYFCYDISCGSNFPPIHLQQAATHECCPLRLRGIEKCFTCNCFPLSEFFAFSGRPIVCIVPRVCQFRFGNYSLKHLSKLTSHALISVSR